MLCIKMDKFFVDSMYQTSCHISRIDLPKYYLRLFLSVVFFFGGRSSNPRSFIT